MAIARLKQDTVGADIVVIQGGSAGDQETGPMKNLVGNLRNVPYPPKESTKFLSTQKPRSTSRTTIFHQREN